jgi:hypothetical protein
MENRERRPRARVALHSRTLQRSRPTDSLTPSRPPARVVITSTYISRAHNYMMDVNTWDYAYDRWDVAALEEALFWFAASGQPIAQDSATERWWDLIRRGRVRTIEASAPRERWTGIKQQVPLLRALDQHEAFGWFLHGRTRRAWEMLQEIKYVGPKIASWLLRDLSFLRDYAADTGDLSVKYSYPERRVTGRHA